MAVQVETYEVTEIDSDGVAELDSEAVELIKKLGLTGQQKLIERKDSGEVSRMPYRKMTKEEHVVYSAIFQSKTALKSYADDAIPVRVLQVAAHACDLFDAVQVWHKPNADIRDPLLVGCKKVKDTFGMTDEFYMLARWGDALVPFEQLATLGAKLIRDEFLNNLEEWINDFTARRESLKACPDSVLRNGAFKMPSVYG